MNNVHVPTYMVLMEPQPRSEAHAWLMPRPAEQPDAVPVRMPNGLWFWYVD